SSDEIDQAVDELLLSVKQLTDPQRRSAWILMLRSAQLNVHTAAGNCDNAAKAFAKVGLALPKCNDALTLAMVMADRITSEPDVAHRAGGLEPFRFASSPVVEHLRNTPLQLPVRAHFDAPIAHAIECAVHQYTQEPGPGISRQLSALFDALRTTRSIEVPAQP